MLDFQIMCAVFFIRPTDPAVGEQQLRFPCFALHNMCTFDLPSGGGHVPLEATDVNVYRVGSVGRKRKNRHVYEHISQIVLQIP